MMASRASRARAELTRLALLAGVPFLNVIGGSAPAWAEAEDPRVVEIVGLIRMDRPADAIDRADRLIAGFAKDQSEPGTFYFCNRSPLGNDRGGIANLIAAMQQGKKVDLAPEAWCEALFAKAYALMRLERHEEAEEAIEDAVAMDPTNPHFLNQAGALALAVGKYSLAINRYGAAHGLAALSPDDPLVRAMDARALRGMGDAAYQLKEYNAAQEHYAASLEIESDNALVRERLAEIVTKRLGEGAAP